MDARRYHRAEPAAAAHSAECPGRHHGRLERGHHATRRRRDRELGHRTVHRTIGSPSWSHHRSACHSAWTGTHGDVGIAAGQLDQPTEQARSTSVVTPSRRAAANSSCVDQIHSVAVGGARSAAPERSERARRRCARNPTVVTPAAPCGLPTGRVWDFCTPAGVHSSDVSGAADRARATATEVNLVDEELLAAARREASRPTSRRVCPSSAGRAGRSDPDVIVCTCSTLSGQAEGNERPAWACRSCGWTVDGRARVGRRGRVGRGDRGRVDRGGDQTLLQECAAPPARARW